MTTLAHPSAILSSGPSPDLGLGGSKWVILVFDGKTDSGLVQACGGGGSG